VKDENLDLDLGLENENEDALDDIENDEENSNEENQPKTGRKGRQPGQKFVQRMAIFQINEKMRARLIEKEKSMHLERKIDSDETDNWKNDGYFGYFDKMLREVCEICTKEKIYPKQVVDCKEMIGILKEVRKDIAKYSQDIVDAIKNDTYLKEIREV
jgi:hypothetical protein